MHETLESTLNGAFLLIQCIIMWLPVRRKACLPDDKWREKVLRPQWAKSPTRIALALLKTVRRLMTFADMLPRAFDKKSMLIDVLLNVATSFCQTSRDAPTFYLKKGLKTRLVLL